jgi:ribonuclease D
VTGKRRENAVAPRSGPSAAPADEGAATPLYLDSAEDADRFLTAIGAARRLALDTEGASFHRFVDRIYLMQLSTDASHAILDPLRIPSLDQLGALLESREVEVVFHDADYDLRLLHQDYGWRTVNIFDTRVAAQLLGIRTFGLAALLERFFGVKLDKKHQRADWSMRPLSTDMLEYAAQDTLHLLGLRDRLRDDLERAGRWHWAQEEFARLEGTRWETDDQSTAFLRIKGARDLSRRELALLRELAVWRDSVAAGMDRATFRVVANDVLLELAQRPPESAAHISGMKGLGARIASQRGSEILEAIARGKAVAENDLPRFPKAPRWDRDPNFDERVTRLKRARDEAAQRLDLDPGVLCGRERLEAVARKNPQSLESLAAIPELRRWQVEELGEAFVAALRNGVTAAAASTGAAGSPYRDG